MFARRSPSVWILALLVVTRAAWADLDVVGDKLVLNAWVRVGAYGWRAENAGLARNQFAFERVSGVAALTGRPSSLVSLKLSGDVSYLQPQDLYVDLRWSSGLGLRAGQFLLPLGFDAMTEPDSQVLASKSFVASFAKSTGTRDIGVVGSYGVGRLAASAAVVNGSGANTWDNNDLKDLCGRVSVIPFPSLDAVLALRAHYGWPDVSDSLWRTAALEARVRVGRLTLQAEYQDQISASARTNTTYLQAVWDNGTLAWVGRFDLDLPRGMHPHWMIDGGVNVRPRDGNFRLMLDCSYNRDYQGNWAVLGFGVGLQAEL